MSDEGDEDGGVDMSMVAKVPGIDLGESRGVCDATMGAKKGEARG